MRQRARNLRVDQLRVVGRALDDDAERDDRVHAALGRHLLDDERNLVCARYPDHRHLFLAAAVAHDAVQRTLEKLVCEDAVEPADDDGELHARRIELSRDFLIGHVLSPFPERF